MERSAKCSKLYQQAQAKPSEILQRFKKILEQPDQFRRISFGCKTLDTLTEGGLPLKQGITEFYGEPGSGKTQICLQLMVSCVQMGYQCAVINTEKRFPIERLTQMVSEVPAMGDSDMNTVLNNFRIAETKDPATVEQLLVRDMELLFKNTRLGLLVIDSVAGLFRDLSDDYKRRAQAMRGFHQCLRKLQNTYTFAIVCTNQVMANIDAQPALGERTANPCLGPIWTEFLTNRFLVTKLHRPAIDSTLSLRSLEVIFSPFLPSDDNKGYFVIETQGLMNGE